MEVMLIKLITGEDIIAECDSTGEQVHCYDPLSLAMHPEKGLVLMKFTPYAKTERVAFDRTSVLCILEPNESLVGSYKELTSKIITPKQGIIY